MSLRPHRDGTRDRGAVAVEFALLLPVLLLIVFGIIDFGRALNAQITLTQAAREGARLAALGDTTAQVQSRATAAATGLSNVTVTVVQACAPGAAAQGLDAEVQASYSFSFVTPIGAIMSMFGSTLAALPQLTAQGVMPCET